MAESKQPSVSPFRAGITFKCPVCGKGKLFSGYLKVTPQCAVCGSALALQDPGDGPAVFVILIIGFLVVGAAMFTEIIYSPPYWVHAVLWLPAILGGSLGLLPLLKSLMFAARYHFDAAEGTSGDTQP